MGNVHRNERRGLCERVFESVVGELTQGVAYRKMGCVDDLTFVERLTNAVGKLQMTTEVRQIVLNELDTVGDLVTVPRADGTFYFMLRVHTDLDPMELTKRLIEEHKVAVMPRMTVGLKTGCYLRIAYGALQKSTAEEGIGRLVKGLKQLIG